MKRMTQTFIQLISGSCCFGFLLVSCIEKSVSDRIDVPSLSPYYQSRIKAESKLYTLSKLEGNWVIGQAHSTIFAPEGRKIGFFPAEILPEKQAKLLIASRAGDQSPQRSSADRVKFHQATVLAAQEPGELDSLLHFERMELGQGDQAFSYHWGKEN